MAQNPKYDNDTVNLGYLNKRLGQTEESINKNNSSISQLPKNYSTPPNPPYYKDSLLCYGNKIYRCNKTKMNGNFSWNDWTIVATDDTTISDFINNTYELDKLEIQEQIDGKVQTYYQENDPSKEWTTDLDKGRHIGDYWYNTTNDTQWRYNRIINGSTITYGWGQVNIPKAVFDTIDSKKSIYTEKPTSYQKDDLWIIEESLSDEDLPVGTEENPIAKGDWVFSIANSDTYNKEHWVKKDEDISMTYIKQHYYTIGEINSSFEEIERNTDSKITKAKDEISLNVSQTYTTKEEHEATIYDFDEKIGTINQTITDHKETISDLSIEVGEITSTVESIQETTKELGVNIDGVSADFEDFKDNEYIQSIDNLQKQIDGAIQFWNGAEIPTIENYPANEWTTENDKINHQADIYTVVEDIDGEMKQGKSYRFDKIDGVWKWIELTDNELSAVQAIAQEALDKVNTNTTEISTIKKNVSELQMTDEQIKASVESIDKQIIPVSTATGSNIYIEDASNNPLINFEIEGKSTQETRSGKNILNLNTCQFWTCVLNDNGTITCNIENSYYASIIVTELNNYLIDNKGKTLTFSTGTPITDRTTSIVIYGTRGDGSTYQEVSETGTGKCSITIAQDFINISRMELRFNRNGTTFTDTTTTIAYAQLEVGSATEYEAYGISPSPDYPSEIESVGYENLFDGELEVGYINIENGNNAISEANIRTKNYIPVQPKTEYRLTGELEKARWIICYDTNKSFLGYIQGTSVSTTGTFVTLENASFIRWYVVQANGVYEKEILTKGSEQHTYISYGKYGIEFETVGKNLIFSTHRIGNSLFFNNTTTQTEYIFKAGTYTLSYDNPNLTSVYIKTASTNQTYLGSNVPTTFTTTEDFNIWIYRSGMTDDETTNIQLEKGGVATECEPHRKATSLIVLNAPLRSLPNGVKDIAYIRNNKLYVDRYVGRRVLNGSEWWTEYTTTEVDGYVYFTPYIEDGSVGFKKSICSHFVNYNSAWDVGKIGQYSDHPSLKYKYFVTDKATVDEFKTWLSTHNTQVDYELAEPYTEEYGEIEIPSTFKGANYISTTDKLLPTINLTYLRDTVITNYVEQHVAELKITENEIKESVESVSSSVDGLNTSINRVEEITTDNSQVINILTTNIDRNSGQVKEVTTTTGFTFNAEGMKINDDSGYSAQHRAGGTYYKDGTKIVGQYTKDGSKQKDLELFGTYSYGKNDIDDTPMFVGQLYNDDNGEECFGHFYNGGDY